MMSLSLFVGLLLFVSVNAQVQLSVRCSNPQGTYVVEEGQTVRVCFTVSNNSSSNATIKSTVEFVTTLTSESSRGIAAANNIDYTYENTTLKIDLANFTQDDLEICQLIAINNDKLTERTEYFNVSLKLQKLRSLPIMLQVTSCQVAILDKNGGPSECYGTAGTGADISLATIMSDTKFCLTGNSKLSQSNICRQDLSRPLADCTSWNQSSFSNVRTSFVVLDQLLPSISDISVSCTETVISQLDTLFRGDNGDIFAPSTQDSCVTNCILTVQNDQTCAMSALLLEQVQRREAKMFLSMIESGRLGSCNIGLNCCDLSQLAVQSLCSEQPSPSTTGTVAENTSKTSGDVIAVAVLCGLLGLLLLAAVVAILLYILYKRNFAVHEGVKSALQAVKLKHLTNHTSKVDSAEEKANTVDCHVAESQELETVDQDYNTIVRTPARSTIRMSDNNAYRSCNGISVENNVAYFAHNIMKSAYQEEDVDDMYDYI